MPSQFTEIKEQCQPAVATLEYSHKGITEYAGLVGLYAGEVGCKPKHGELLEVCDVREALPSRPGSSDCMLVRWAAEIEFSASHWTASKVRNGQR